MRRSRQQKHPVCQYALWLVAVFGSVSQADILYLRDGSRHYGEFVSEERGVIAFRVALSDDGSSLLHKYPARDVERIDRTGRLETAPRADSDARVGAIPPADCEQMLREASELLDDGDLSAALRTIQVAVTIAQPTTLKAMEAECQATRGVALAELLATTRVQVAELASRGRTFKLLYATPYERRALGRVLEAALRERLDRRYDEHSVAEWASQPAEYRETRADSRRLVADATHAAAFIGARLKFDPAMKEDRVEHSRMARLQDDLARLAIRVQSLRGYWATFRKGDENAPGADAVHQAITDWSATTQPATAVDSGDTQTPREEIRP